jgi:hypothetical protein
MNKTLLSLTALLVSVLARAQSPNATPTPATPCQFHILADDSFELFINGKPTWQASDYQHVLQKELPLRRGDVVVVTVTDKDGGQGGAFAAVLLRDNALLASSKDFRYTVAAPADFTTSPSLLNLRVPELTPLQRSFGLGPDKQPKRAWTQKSDRKYGVVHFKYVVPQ